MVTDLDHEFFPNLSPNANFSDLEPKGSKRGPKGLREASRTPLDATWNRGLPLGSPSGTPGGAQGPPEGAPRTPRNTLRGSKSRSRLHGTHESCSENLAGSPLGANTTDRENWNQNNYFRYGLLSDPARRNARSVCNKVPVGLILKWMLLKKIITADRWEMHSIS